MDPTYLFAEVRDGFAPRLSQQEAFAKATVPYETDPSVTINLTFAPIELPPSGGEGGEGIGIDFADPKHYTAIQLLKDKFASVPPDQFIKARNAAYPFEHLGNSIFANRAAIKLANTDAIYQLSGDWRLNRFTAGSDGSDGSEGEPFIFCDIASGPGAFTQYLQWRLPQSKGIGITLRGAGSSLEWDKRIIDLKRFTIFDGLSESGDLYLESLNFITYVREKYPLGVNLVTGDGGIASGDGLKQEIANARLLMCQVLVAIGCCATGGCAVIKVFDTVTTISAQVIYLLTSSFGSVSIFKPLSSRPANAERYVVAIDRNEDVSALEILIQAFKVGKPLAQIFNPNELPQSFKEWLTAQNEASLTSQEVASQRIVDIIENKEIADSRSYDTTIPFLLWNLPESRRK